VVYKQGEETEEIFFVESGGVKFVREILNQTALRKMNVLRDGPVAAAAIALHDKGGFDATPPPPPGVDDTENETIDEFSHLHGTRSLASSLRGESRGSSRARTPNAFPGLAGDRLCEFETIGGHASEAAAAFNENERRGVENNDANTNTTPTASGPKFANSVPTLGDTPLTGDTVGHDGGSCQPTLGMRRTEFGTEFNAKSFGGGSFGGFKTSAAFGVDESTVSAKHRGLGRLFLEAGRAGALDYFGDVVLTKKLTQPASAITTEPTKCFVLNKWDMLKRVDRDVVRRFRSSKSRAMKFYADEPAILAEFQRAMTWDRYKKSLVLEVVTDKSERQKGGR
jgi:CRP-like cAMP-binding protein